MIRLISVLEGIKYPGLNDVLKQYEATHGINELKYEMGKKFRSSESV